MKNSVHLFELFSNYMVLFYLFASLISILQFYVFTKVNDIGIIGSMFALLILYLLFDRNKNIHINRSDIFFIFISLFYFIYLCLYLYAFPLFPLKPSGDFLVHLSNAINLISGNIRDNTLFPNSIIALLLANWLSLTSENILFASRFFMLIMIWSIIPVLYTIGENMRKSSGGVIASLIYIIFNPFFYFTLIETGLYSNAIGLLFFLSTLYMFIKFSNTNSLKAHMLIFLFTAFSLLAHSSNILLIPTIIITTFYLNYIEKIKVELKYLITILISPLLVLILSPISIFRLPSVLSGPIFILGINMDPISRSLSFIPILEYMYDLSPLVICIFFFNLIAAIKSIYYRKCNLNILVFTWLVLIIIASYFASSNVIRLSLIAYTPLSLLTIQSYTEILEPFYHFIKSKLPNQNLRYFFKIIGAIFVLIILIFSILYSPTGIIFPINASSWSRNQQSGFYECMIWFKENSETDATVISIGGHPMMYLPFVAHRYFIGRFPGENPEVVYKILENYSNGYVVVWNRLHPYNGSFYYVDLYKNSSLFREVWSNSEVTVFKLVKKE